MTSKFPSPHDVEKIPGTEGWERMYPYQYQFVEEDDDPERHQYEKDAFWFYDGLHYPEPIYPFDFIWDEAWFLALSQNNTRVFSLPPVNGIDHRNINGYPYIATVPVKDPEEVGARVEHFMERAGYYYENWNDLEAKWEVKMKGIIGELENLKIPGLPELEDISAVKEGTGESSGFHLLQAYDKLIDLGIQCWQYHFEFLNLGYASYVTFMDFAQNMFPDIPAQRVTQMISGIDVIMYRPDEELKKLAKLAIELGLAEQVKANKNIDTLRSVLGEANGGSKWLAAFEEARHPWFNVSTGTGWYHHDKSWNDDLTIPLGSIGDYIAKIQKGDSIDRPLAEVQKQRDEITAEYRALITTDEDRATFDQLLGTAKLVFPYVENHLFYVEHWFHSVFWNKVREVSTLLTGHGIFEDVEDVWYLKRSEVKDAIWDMVTAWATGVKPRGQKTWPREIAWRKGVMEKFKAWSPPPAIGTKPEVIQDPFAIVLWGVTNESLNSWAELAGNDDPTSIKSFTGFAGSPGKARGKARVCRTVAEVAELEDGEILVAPTTSPSWAPVFSKIGACVTDVGGVMSHAAIVCREYGMPAVVGTGHATKIIQTGQMIEVDGTTGEINIV
ncbi:MAG: PEP-utilizing enzyme [Alphaproteobacteria bacterium]|nr:PEP-utilizing enzyme [Rhodospirillales bacterium]MCW9046023.1 PEP-utilizing enzyme [Alphaproteobacteria bacterium]